MKRYLQVICIAMVMAGMGSAFSAEIRISASCRQGECNRVWLISKTQNRNGTFTVKTRTEQFSFGDNPDSSKEPDRFDTVTVSCSPRNGYVRSQDGESTREPPPSGSGAHATCEPDSLWAKVCGRKVETIC
jgi:hypothetical protein